MRQQTLAAQTGFEKYGRKSKRERFLEEMEQRDRFDVGGGLSLTGRSIAANI